MKKDDVIFIEQLWLRLTGKQFTPIAFVKQVHCDGGVDMSNLSTGDLLQLLEGSFSGDWHNPAFAFSELLAFYSVPEENRAKEEIVGWVFASFVMRDAIAKGESEWQMEFNNFMRGFLEVRNQLEIHEAVEIFYRVLQCEVAEAEPARVTMAERDIILIHRVWERLTGRKFVFQELLKQIHGHLGVNMSSFADEDLLRLIQMQFSGNWREIALAFSKCLAYYGIPNAKRERSLTKEDIVVWIVSSFIIADAIGRGVTDWRVQFNKFIDSFVEVRRELETDETIEIFQRIFHA